MFIRFKTPQGESFIRNWDDVHGINPLSNDDSGDPAKSLIVYRDLHHPADEINETLDEVMDRIERVPVDAWIVK